MSSRRVGLRAGALIRRELRFLDQRLADAALFPMFDRAGQTDAVLIVRRDAPKLHLLAWRPRLFDLPRGRGAISIDARLADQGELATRGLSRADGLWHFDPWWLLTVGELAQHPAVPVLKATNCVEAWPEADVSGLRFRRDLGAVTQLVLADAPDDVPFAELGFRPGPSSAGDGAIGGWLLDPIWNGGWKPFSQLQT